MSQSYDLLVGTFNTPQLYTLRFTPPTSPSTSDSTSTSTSTSLASSQESILSPSTSTSNGSLEIIHRAAAIGSHSWLHLTPRKANGTRNLYATAWTEPPSVVAYAVKSATEIELLGRAATQSRSGYVTANHVAVYSAGGATGEVFSINRDTGAFMPPPKTGDKDHRPDGSGSKSLSSSSIEPRPLQTLSFVDSSAQRDDGSVMDFGGLRHGAHSADLSPSGRALYIADIGRNCIWTYSVSPVDGSLTLGEKHISPRPNDGPRHVWPHPTGDHVYCVQEHTSIVDVFSTTGKANSNSDNDDGVHLTHRQAVRIIPPEEDEHDFWADEVRTSLSSSSQPQYLYASTRGLKPDKKGYVAVYKLAPDGTIDENDDEGTRTRTTTTTTTTTRTSSSPVSRSSPVDTRSESNLSDRDTNVSAGEENDLKASYNGLLCMYETPTSGGWANAIQPGPTVGGVEYLVLTDSEEGWVFILGWDGAARKMREVARTKLDDGAGAATAVWL
ncbi:Muconate cycloisomerase 1 [Exophiala dermatitidis]